MSDRPFLHAERTHKAVQHAQQHFHAALVAQVEESIQTHAVVVVGMAQNPWPRKARTLLNSQGIAFHSLEIGSYCSQWKARLALKMWAGWPTFPMVFVHGILIGGFSDLLALHKSGELQLLLHPKNE